jgi:hypothetical protein
LIVVKLCVNINTQGQPEPSSSTESRAIDPVSELEGEHEDKTKQNKIEFTIRPSHANVASSGYNSFQKRPAQKVAK